MTAATASVFDRPKREGSAGVSKIGYEIVNAAAVYFPEYQALCGPNHGTSASKGRQKSLTSAAHEIPIGFQDAGYLLGNTSAAQMIKGECDARNIVRRVPVANLTGDRTDHGIPIYMTDGNTPSIVRPSVGLPFGIIVEYISTTEAWVMFFSFEVLTALAFCGGGKEVKLVGIATAGAGTGNVATGVKLYGHGKITACYGIVIVDATDADVVQTLNLELGGTDVTGGVITWSFGDTIGTKNAGTAITAANEFHDGDLLDIETVATVAGTTSDPGLIAVYAEIEYLPGL